MTNASSLHEQDMTFYETSDLSQRRPRTLPGSKCWRLRWLRASGSTVCRCGSTLQSRWCLWWWLARDTDCLLLGSWWRRGSARREAFNALFELWEGCAALTSTSSTGFASHTSAGFTSRTSDLLGGSTLGASAGLTYDHTPLYSIQIRGPNRVPAHFQLAVTVVPLLEKLSQHIDLMSLGYLDSWIPLIVWFQD